VSGERRLTRARLRLRRAVRGDLDAERLRAAGVVLEGRISIESGVWVDLEWGWLIEFGDRVTLSPHVMVFAHDAATKRALGYTRVAPVRIGARTYIGAGSIVLPGVSIGADSVVGAGSVVTRDVPDGAMAVGAPARVVRSAADHFARRAHDIDTGLVLDEIRDARTRDDWSRGRASFGEQVRLAGQAWVK
jgi:maltose O-acetyltransferase